MMDLFKRKELPPVGSTYTITKGAHRGISGIVEHHLDGKAFMINLPSGGAVVNIKPIRL